ncbi:lysoplasmalogenase [Actinomarinicola tropica]|nr:lysoplasmalogenase [Actinomarinicola tropica]
MSSLAWALAALAAASALTDWWAVAAERPSVRHVAKPATLVALVGVALAVDPAQADVRAWMVAGLILSLVGDVVLMLPERWFVGGLVAFLLGHVAYVVGLQLAPTDLAWTLIGISVVGAAAGTIGREIVRRVAAGRHRALTGPVIAYLVVISAMVVSAFGTTSLVAAVGALLFYASDATLAWNRFVEPLRYGPLAVMVTYHLGQAGLVAWIATG